VQVIRESMMQGDDSLERKVSMVRMKIYLHTDYTMKIKYYRCEMS